MDKQTFSARVLGMEARLYRIAYLSCGRDGCEDAVQEALLKAWRARNSLHEQRYFETWLIRIVLNECKNWYRKNPAARSNASQERLPAPEPPAPTLRDAVCVLPPKYRAPLLLHCLEDDSVKETAAILRITPGTVRWRPVWCGAQGAHSPCGG